LSKNEGASGPNIFEVSSNKEKNLECNCPGFVVKGLCRHTKLVALRIKENDGVYPFEFLTKVDAKQIKAAMKTEAAFRDFIIKNSRIEVLSY
jgi:hypothetical protein